jgi:hypothetical protein
MKGQYIFLHIIIYSLGMGGKKKQTHTHTHTHTHALQIKILRQIHDNSMHNKISNYDIFFLVVLQPNPRSWPAFSGLHNHIQWHTTLSRTPPNDWSAQCRDLYLTTHNTQQATNINAPRWDSNPQSQQVSGRLRLCGHWDQQIRILHSNNFVLYTGHLVLEGYNGLPI